VRFWQAPRGWRLPGGASVDWIGSASYDRGVGLSLFTLQITHKIASNTDVERDHILRTLRAADPAAEVEVISNFSTGYHSHTGGGDAIETDGDLPIVSLSKVDAEPLVDRNGPSNRIQRPPTVYIAYVLTLLRGLVAVATAFAALIVARSVPDVGWLVAAAIVGGVSYLVLAHLTFSGRPLARLAILSLSVVGALIALFGGHHVVGHGGTVWLANLMLDIGILLSLSAGDVRAFQLRVAADRRTARRR